MVINHEPNALQSHGNLIFSFQRSSWNANTTYGARGIKGKIELNEDYETGLKDLDGFSHIILIYHFHLSSGYSLEVKPFLDRVKRGIFATRAPKQLNFIGISVVRLEKIEGSYYT
jgi:tRNA (adenine37-N6)-methyltransferase